MNIDCRIIERNRYVPKMRDLLECRRRLVIVMIVVSVISEVAHSFPLALLTIKSLDSQSLRISSTPLLTMQYMQRRREQHIILARGNIQASQPYSLSLYASKKSKKQQLASGTKGFGAVVGIASPTANDLQNQSLAIEIDRSKPTRSFYENTLESHSITASDNLKRTALAFTYNASEMSENTDSTFKLRGVVATRAIPKGNDVITIPYEIALDLGPEGKDPTIAALVFLNDYCSVLLNSNSEKSSPIHHQRQSYYRMLPPYESVDSLGCTNFFSQEALNELQSPYIVQETMQRRFQIQRRYEEEILPLQTGNDSTSPWLWIDGITPISIDHLTWAVWVITSRVLTVQSGSRTDDGPSAVQYRRLLIPYLDMCNHDRNSLHLLTGRADAGGLLKIVAGANVNPGTPVEICYGGGFVGNDRFLQDYGFLDCHPDAYKFVAMDLLGQKRRAGGSDSGMLSLKDREECLDMLRATSIEEDEVVLSNMMANTVSDHNVQVAIQYRIGVKKAVKEFDDGR
jgi:SET domain